MNEEWERHKDDERVLIHGESLRVIWSLKESRREWKTNERRAQRETLEQVKKERDP